MHKIGINRSIKLSGNKAIALYVQKESVSAKIEHRLLPAEWFTAPSTFSRLYKKLYLLLRKKFKFGTTTCVEVSPYLSEKVIRCSGSCEIYLLTVFAQFFLHRAVKIPELKYI